MIDLKNKMYILEFIASNGKVFRMAVSNGKTHIYALTMLGDFLLTNNIKEIKILECKNYICNKEQGSIEVLGID